MARTTWIECIAAAGLAALLAACGGSTDSANGGNGGGGGTARGTGGEAGNQGVGGNGNGGSNDGGGGAGPSPQQVQDLAALDQYTNDLRDYTGYSKALDFEAIRKEAHQLLLAGDGSDYALAKAIHHVFKSVPQGHAATGYGPSDFSACESSTTKMPLLGISWYGVCGRSLGDASVVTYAAKDNALGLNAGDRVTGATVGGENWKSPGFLDRIGEEPICDTGVPNTSARHDYAATNLFAILDHGAKLAIESPDGTKRSVDVPARGASYIQCYDPFGRSNLHEDFTMSQRPDGVVVVVLQTFGSTSDHPYPNPLTLQSYRDWIAESVDAINTALTGYQGITGLIWDVRGNSGGAQEYAVDLVAPELLTSAEGALANCHARVPKSSPPAFDQTMVEYPFPYQVFVDDPLPTVAFNGKMAVVTDGLAVSAGDWISYVAKKVNVPVVGHGSAGAYGYTDGKSWVNKNITATTDHEQVISYISGAECIDAATKMPMEGTAPCDSVVDFDPADLANGVDTQLEAAAKLLLAP